MEYLNKSKICREFLNQYSDSLIPEILPKIFKIAIYALHKTYHKWTFSIQELDQFINCCYYKNRDLELESKYYNDCPPPCKEYLIPKINPIQKLNMGFRPPEGESISGDENGAAIDCFGYGKFYPNDDVYINEKNNFYDENYYIPRTRSYRNIQLYHKRLSNPKFITQEKKIYPHWWWNLKDDIEQEDYSDDDSDLDHIHKDPQRFPKDIEDKYKKKAKRYLRNKSFSGTRPIINGQYDESRIFANSNLNTNNNLDNSPYPKRNNSPYPSDDESQPPYRRTANDEGFGRPYPNRFNNNEPNSNDPNNNYPNNDNNNTLSNSPFYSTSPNLNYRPGNGRNTLGMNVGGPLPGSDNFRNNNGNNNYSNPENGSEIPYNQNKQGNNNLGVGNGSNGRGTGLNNNLSLLSGSSLLKAQIKNKRGIKQSTLLSFDKDFNVNGFYKKVRGQEKKGLKYSLSGNQLKEDKKGIRRREKPNKKRK